MKLILELSSVLAIIFSIAFSSSIVGISFVGLSELFD